MSGMHADLSLVDPLVVNLTHRAALGDVLTRGAQTYGDRTAVVDGDHEVSYRELDARANAVARGLLADGLERGDAVALQIQNRWEFVVTFFACAKIGVVAMPLNLALPAADIAYQLADSGVRAVVAEEAFLPVLEEALHTAEEAAVRSVHVIGSAPAEVAGRRAADFRALLDNDTATVEVVVEDRDILHCLYTSGTTSLPKGVVTSHVAVLIASLTSALEFGLPRGRRGAVMPIVLPLFHVTGLDVLLLPMLVTGGTAVLHRGFDPETLLDDLAVRRATHVALLPAMWGALLDHPRLGEIDTTSLRVGIYAMAPMPAQRLEAIRAAFPRADVILGSGQTETTPLSELQWPEHQGEKDNSWGPPVATTDVRIMGPDGGLLPPGEEGEIVYRTPQLMDGYWNNPGANAEAFAHGWFHGGDVGYLDEEGVVWFTDRTKDMIKTGGENVSSVEVERAVLAHESVAECAVIGMPDDRWGEAVTAFVVAAPGRTVDPQELRAVCKRNLAGFKVPKHFEVVGALPKTATGKIRKHELRRS
ncbi:class I adenylate-forming enzyme family protein [Saccharopolyspora taberi]|uniref:Acyl-CoA synthetase n=1 Tax=Saccharopolyspora taberi TaxID=60895 RepID=A0ABN3VF70_9PSEU